MKIKGNIFIENGTAISLPKDAWAEIEDNFMSGNKVGIEIRDDAVSLINSLKTEILKANISDSEKSNLSRDILSLSSSKTIDEDAKNKVIERLKLVSADAVSFFLKLLPLIIKLNELSTP